MAKKRKRIRNVTFSFKAPNALSVLLVGEFTEWQQRAVAMEKDKSGVWTTTIKLRTGTHRYLYIVDGDWCEDPACATRLANPYGGHDMVRKVE